MWICKKAPKLNEIVSLVCSHLRGRRLAGCYSWFELSVFAGWLFPWSFLRGKTWRAVTRRRNSARGPRSRPCWRTPTGLASYPWKVMVTLEYYGRVSSLSVSLVPSLFRSLLCLVPLPSRVRRYTVTGLLLSSSFFSSLSSFTGYPSLSARNSHCFAFELEFLTRVLFLWRISLLDTVPQLVDISEI